MKREISASPRCSSLPSLGAKHLNEGAILDIPALADMTWWRDILDTVIHIQTKYLCSIYTKNSYNSVVIKQKTKFLSASPLETRVQTFCRLAIRCTFSSLSILSWWCEHTEPFKVMLVALSLEAGDRACRVSRASSESAPLMTWLWLWVLLASWSSGHFPRLILQPSSPVSHLVPFQ